MTRLQVLLTVFALAGAIAGLMEPGLIDPFVPGWWIVAVPTPLLAAVPWLDRRHRLVGAAFIGIFSFCNAVAALALTGSFKGPEIWWFMLAAWFSAWLFAEWVSTGSVGVKVISRFVVPMVFGVTLLFLWQTITRGAGVSPVILPAPSAIWDTLTDKANIPTLQADFVQTVLRSVLPGYAIGCGAAFLTSIAIDRSPFLQRGLLPVGNLAAALPIVGIAPIMVMWFGFDWQSKAAVIVVMCFFPMLVNTMQGLASAEAMQKDLMQTYAANYWQTLLKLRLPAAGPFIFNGLKICTTLALIGAIVAEFFGTPTVGMGFRISTEIGRMALDMVWAEIAVAALAGSAFYGTVALAERAATFWHPSIRGGH